MVFTGTFQRSLDSKFRALLPKRLRNSIPEGQALYLTPGTDQCLELHTDDSLQELASKADRSSAGHRNVRSFSRLFYARAEQCDIDKQGRIRIPSALAQVTELEKDIVFIGVGSHWEVWNQARWECYLETQYRAFDEIAESTFDPPQATLKNQQRPRSAKTDLVFKIEGFHRNKFALRRVQNVLCFANGRCSVIPGHRITLFCREPGHDDQVAKRFALMRITSGLRHGCPQAVFRWQIVGKCTPVRIADCSPTVLQPGGLRYS